MPLTSAPFEPAPPPPLPPGEVQHRVWHYDGVSGIRRTAMLETEGARFRLVENGVASEDYAFADLVSRDGQAGEVVFGLKKRPGWKIGFTGGLPRDVAAHFPRTARYGGWIDRFGLWPSVAVFMLLAAVVVTLFLRTPAAVARAVPPAWERKLGDLMVGDFGNRSCTDPAGAAALRALVERVDPRDPEIDVRIVNLPVVNAVTLPGGRIVLFDGLVKAASSPDEVAGVLAHEIGHVKHRDVLESLLRQLGLSVLLGGLDGNIGGYTNTLLAATYSRGAEQRADGYAIDALKTAQVSPLPTAGFFRRLSGEGEAPAKKAKVRTRDGVERVMNYFSTHPISSDRAARFVASAKGASGYRAALTADEWASLRTICSNDPDVEKPGFGF